MTLLIAAALVFLGIHLLISGTRLRDVIAGAIGEGPYLGLFSLASLAAIVWLVMAFNAAQASADNRILYTQWIGVRHLAIPIVALAFLLAVPGLLLPNPTSLKQESAAAKGETVRGVLRITRHPFLWGVAIWSAFHVSANGDEASVIFFGTFLLLALFGTFSIDAKRRRKMGEAWTGFAAKTSNIPFAAIFAGRNALKLGEILDWRFLIAAAAFLAVLFSHAHLFGASPFPNGWAPY
jgi:uncharacterized membrane protein